MITLIKLAKTSWLFELLPQRKLWEILSDRNQKYQTLGEKCFAGLPKLHSNCPEENSKEIIILPKKFGLRPNLSTGLSKLHSTSPEEPFRFKKRENVHSELANY